LLLFLLDTHFDSSFCGLKLLFIELVLFLALLNALVVLEDVLDHINYLLKLLHADVVN
jgi:hypothetical protein